MAEKRSKQPTDEEMKKAKALDRWNNEGGAPAKPPKRPRDLNQWAKRMVDLATMDEHELATLRERLAKKEKPKRPRQRPGKRTSSS
jgi:hypothetical protein